LIELCSIILNDTVKGKSQTIVGLIQNCKGRPALKIIDLTLPGLVQFCRRKSYSASFFCKSKKSNLFSKQHSYQKEKHLTNGKHLREWKSFNKEIEDHVISKHKQKISLLQMKFIGFSYIVSKSIAFWLVMGLSQNYLTRIMFSYSYSYIFSLQRVTSINNIFLREWDPREGYSLG